MRTMSWEEIDKDWGGLQKRHRMEIAEAVARYCVGHTIDEVSKRLNQSRDWVQSRLDFAGLCAGVGGPTPQIVGSSRGALEDAARVVKEFGPAIEVKMQGQGGEQTIAAVEGKDAEQFGVYLDHYIDQGHEPAAALRLAKAEWAAESAVEAGVIKEDVNKRNEKVNRILFPDDQKDTFELDLQTHMANVKRAAKFLDECKVPYLRRKKTCEMVASANEKWLEQVERVRNLHNKESVKPD